METEMKIKPNANYECISYAYCFTKDNFYKTDGDGIIYDDDNSPRPVISSDANFFFERFKEVNLIEPLDYAGTQYENIECIILDSGVKFVAIEGNNACAQVKITKDEAIGMAKFILKSFNATF